MRFLVGRQVTGQLEHPSIVRLHDLGFDDDGEPFYVMKPIKRTSTHFGHHIIPRPQTVERGPSDRQFRRLLELFIDVATPLRTVHSKGALLSRYQA